MTTKLSNETDEEYTTRCSDKSDASTFILRWALSLTTTVVLALITALWVNLNSQITDLKIDQRGMEIKISDLHATASKLENQISLLVDSSKEFVKRQEENREYTKDLVNDLIGKLNERDSGKRK